MALLVEDEDPNSIGSNRRQSLEYHHDGCLDHEHHLKPKSEDSHFHFFYTHPSKRGRMETRNGKHEWWENAAEKEKEETVRNLTWQQQQPPLTFPHFPLHPSFTHVNALHTESDFLKIFEKGKGYGKCGSYKNRKFKSSRSIEDEDKYEIPLTLSLHHPSTQRSSNGSSTSEISEVHSRPNVNNGSSNKCSINIDLSIALCGN